MCWNTKYLSRKCFRSIVLCLSYFRSWVSYCVTMTTKRSQFEIQIYFTTCLYDWYSSTVVHVEFTDAMPFVYFCSLRQCYMYIHSHWCFICMSFVYRFTRLGECINTKLNLFCILLLYFSSVLGNNEDLATVYNNWTANNNIYFVSDLSNIQTCEIKIPVQY